MEITVDRLTPMGNRKHIYCFQGIVMKQPLMSPESLSGFQGKTRRLKVSFLQGFYQQKFIQIQRLQQTSRQAKLDTSPQGTKNQVCVQCISQLLKLAQIYYLLKHDAQMQSFYNAISMFKEYMPYRFLLHNNYQILAI